MPRKSRIDAPGALQHVIARGINRQMTFRFLPAGGEKQRCVVSLLTCSDYPDSPCHATPASMIPAPYINPHPWNRTHGDFVGKSFSEAGQNLNQSKRMAPTCRNLLLSGKRLSQIASFRRCLACLRFPYAIPGMWIQNTRPVRPPPSF